MSNKEMKNRNDSFEKLFNGIADEMLPPPELEQAVIAGSYYQGKVAAGMHIRKITGAIVAYAVGVMLLLGAVLLLPRLFGEYPPVISNPHTTTTPSIDTTDQVGPVTTSPLNPNDPIHSPPKSLDGVNFAQQGLSQEERTLRILYTEGSHGVYTRRSLVPDEELEYEIDMATKTRNLWMQERLGLELMVEECDWGISGMETVVGNALATGNCNWDILAAYQYYGMSLAQKGYMVDLARLADYDANYIDLNASYWGKAYNQKISYKGEYNWITGDLALRYVGGMYATFVNAEIYDQYLKPNYGSIYTIAQEGKWTLDLLIEMASRCYEDNGAVAGVPDEGDTFGFGWESNDMIDAMALGAAAKYSGIDNAGGVTITVNNPHTFDIAQKLNSLTHTGEFTYNYPDQDSYAVMTAFAQGNLAFTVNKLYYAEYCLPIMEDNYYIIPTPKFDETQENYITAVHESCTVFGILKNSNKKAQAAAALEYMCKNSSKDVTPHFYESVLKGRYTRSREAAAMIDLIRSTATTDFAIAWGTSIDGITSIFRECKPLSENTIERRLTAWENKLAQLIGELESE